MQLITYNNTKTTLPNFSEEIHESQPKGYAYETDTHFVHLYGRNKGIWVISTGLTVTEKKEGTLQDWVIRVFGAKNIKISNSEVGETFQNIWRPGLLGFDKIIQGLNIDKLEQRDSMQSLRILLDKLDDILLYIEPSVNGINTYSHKTRELLILACTEIENYWTGYFRDSNTPPLGRNYNTKDYIKLKELLYLNDYQIRIKIKSSLQTIVPFQNWSNSSPTSSLVWYDAYNKTKHNRFNHFAEATLANCLHAIAANIVMFSVRYGPYILWHGSNSTSSIFNQLFDIELLNPDPASFYVPSIEVHSNQKANLVVYDSKRFIKPFVVNTLVI